MRTEPLPTHSNGTLVRTASAHARAMGSVALSWVALLSTNSWAHDGHGLPGSHWHASDTLGLLLGAVAVAAVWLWKGKP